MFFREILWLSIYLKKIFKRKNIQFGKFDFLNSEMYYLSYCFAEISIYNEKDPTKFGSRASSRWPYVQNKKNIGIDAEGGVHQLQ